MFKSLKELLDEKDPKDVTPLEIAILTTNELAVLHGVFTREHKETLLEEIKKYAGTNAVLIFCDGKLARVYEDSEPQDIPLEAEVNRIQNEIGKICYIFTTSKPTEAVMSFGNLAYF